MSIQMSEAEARRAGLVPKKAGTKKPRAKRDGAASVCVECGERFTGDAAEDRHVTETHHARYETEIT